MADDNIIIEHLRHIRTKVDRIDERQDRMELRLSTVEETLGHLYAMSGSDRKGTSD